MVFWSVVIAKVAMFESVLIQHYQRTGNDQFDAPTGDKELDAWLEWRHAALYLFETANKPADVKLPLYPNFPAWYRQTEQFRQFALKLGYKGSFNPEVR
jgi:hypothetical protein